ncbi:MAG: exodeoxyribonuclease VII large subunit [Bacteroidales bacterium]|nr:exodeoxyribonuclease VII large subunit [Bacteroidales bacterium]
MEKEYISLSGLLDSMKAFLEGFFPDRIWVRAEISSLNRKQNGHCYLDLSESGPDGVVAKVRATIWASRWNYIEQYFRSVTHSSLDVGMEILARVRVNFHPVFGLSLDIDEIDPDFTLGAGERKKQETIDRLTREGLMDLQKRLRLPLLPYSLAVISAPGAAGWGDFRKHLTENEYGFVFNVKLFEAVMQGEGAPASIIGALEGILTGPVRYDAVLILRGGGSELDLACFDDYSLAARIARCPLPVFTAIGHDKDYHVADMVANTFVKTPTALADLFLDCYISEDERLSAYESRLRISFNNRLSSLSNRLDRIRDTVRLGSLRLVDKAESHLALVEEKIRVTNPANILRRGFVLPLDGRGVKLKGAAGSKPGDVVQMLFLDGRLKCRVEETLPPPEGALMGDNE